MERILGATYLGLVFHLVMCASSAWAMPVFQLSPAMEGKTIASNVLYLEDPKATLSFEQVSKAQWAQKFSPLPGGSANFGQSASAFWIRLEVENQTDKPIDWYIGAETHRHHTLDLYVVHDDGTVTKKSTSDLAPYEEREVDSISLDFPLTTDQGRKEVVYLRYLSMRKGLSDATLSVWSAKAFGRHSNQEYILLGLFYGSLIVMFFYNLFLFITLRNPVFFYICSYIFGAILTYASINNIGKQYLWPDLSMWTYFAPGTLIMFSYMGLAQFTRTFLETPKIVPRVDYFIRLFFNICAALFFASIALYTLTYFSTAAEAVFSSLVIAFYLMAGLVFILPAIAFYLMIKGSRPARVYVAAWLVYSIGIFIYALADLGLLEHTAATVYTLQVGSWMEVILFSMAIGGRIKILDSKTKDAERRYSETLEKATKGA